MNAGPDVERRISSWLAEEVPTRAPDRILPAAFERTRHTHQRRFGAAWRSITMNRTWQLAIGDRGGDSIRGRGLAGEDGDVGPEAAAASELVVDGAHQEAAQPGVEAVDLAQRGQVAPAAHQRLLGRILGAIRVAQDEPRHAVAVIDDACRQDLEGIVIAAARPLDQLAVHGPSRAVRAAVLAALIP